MEVQMINWYVVYTQPREEEKAVLNLENQGDQVFLDKGSKLLMNRLLYSDEAFVAYWNTSEISTGSSASNQVSLPLINGGSYNFVVKWGDGTYDHITSWNQSEVTHNYSQEGVYSIIIEGNITGFAFISTGDKLKLYDVLQWGNLKLGNSGGYFQGAANFNFIGDDILDLTGTFSFHTMFDGASSFNAEINDWNTTGITNMAYTFRNAASFR